MGQGELEDARHAWLDLQRRLTAMQVQLHNLAGDADRNRDELERLVQQVTIEHNAAQDRYFFLRRRAEP